MHTAISSGFRALLLIALCAAFLLPSVPSAPKGSAAAGRPPESRLLLVPLDGRPPCRQFVIDAGRIGGTDVMTPPSAIQDYYSQPGDTGRMRAWLMEQAGSADAIIVSIDQLLYGGLLAAREREAKKEDIEELAAFLRALRAAHPATPIYAFSILPRLMPQDTIDGYEERRDLIAYSRLVGKKAAGLPIDEAELACRKKAIPPGSLARYLAHFSENEAMSEQLIDLAEEGVLTRLVLGQDDGESYGIPNIEKNALADYIKAHGLTEKQVFLTHGADEIALTLLAAWKNEQTGFHPRVFLRCNDPSTAKNTMPYMAVSTGECAAEKIRLIGGTLADAPKDADLILAVSTNDSERDTLGSRAALADYIAKAAPETPIALVDLSRHFTAEETVLPQLLARSFPLHTLAAYAGWNTTSNALGTALAEGSIYLASPPASDKEARARAAENARFLDNRIFEDYFYLKNTIDAINRTLKKVGYENTADLDLTKNYRFANAMLQHAMRKDLAHYKKAPAFAAPFPVRRGNSAEELLRLHDAALDTSFPWPRTFEIHLEIIPSFR